MGNHRPVKPSVTRSYHLRVVRSQRLSPSFQRVTVTGASLREFEWMGFDQWFRLFIPQPEHPADRNVRMPNATSALWFAQYLATPQGDRPQCSNYTIREYRADSQEIDIDFVIHQDVKGNLAGGAAIWACGASPGNALGILDQGILFNPPTRPSATMAIHLVADETGLPAVEGILRALPRNAKGTAILEVPTYADRRDLPMPYGFGITWAVRGGAEIAGRRALKILQDRRQVDPQDYAFIVGESALATGGRHHMTHIGLPKERIAFAGYWKHQKSGERLG